jgi:hypothetical protein
LQLIDGGEQIGDLVAGLVKILRDRRILLFAAFDLRLQILDCAIDIADGTGVGETRRLRIFKRFLELYHLLIKHTGGRSKTYLLNTPVKEADVLACGAAVAFGLEIHQSELEVLEVLANETLLFV